MKFISFILCLSMIFISDIKAEDIANSSTSLKNIKEDEVGLGLKNNIVRSTKIDTKKSNLIDFKANNIEYNFKNDIIIATGNVEFKEDGQIIKADKNGKITMVQLGLVIQIIY